MTKPEARGLAMLVVMVAAVLAGVVWIILSVCNDADEERAVAWERFEQRLELCSDVPGRDFQGCMDRERVKAEKLRRHTDAVE